MPKKSEFKINEVSIFRSSAAEYLIFVAAIIKKYLTLQDGKLAANRTIWKFRIVAHEKAHSFVIPAALKQSKVTRFPPKTAGTTEQYLAEPIEVETTSRCNTVKCRFNSLKAA